MTSETCNNIFEQCIADYHLHDHVDATINNPFHPKSIEHLLYLKNWIDTVQWHLEDLIRDPQIDPVEALRIKRLIDASNQQRTDVVEYIDSWLMEQYKNVQPLAGASLNTETPAWAIDRLSILDLKVYHMRIEAQRPGASEEQRASAQNKLDVLLMQRSDLSTAIDQLLADIAGGRKYMKLYKQMKMYNDESLNPVLYAQKKKIVASKQMLVLRFSALGDVAMTVPVIKNLLQQHKELHVIFVSRPFMKPLFNGIDRLHFYAVDVDQKHKGVLGLFRLHRELKKAYKIDFVADLHDVLRTKLLRTFFFLSGIPVAAIDKGRKEKKELTRPQNKKLRPLKSTFQRYADVFQRLRYPVALRTNDGIKAVVPWQDLSELRQQGYKLVGIAPFALHAEKCYPLDQMKKVIHLLSQHGKMKLFFLGSKSDSAILQQWNVEYKTARNVAGEMSFTDELELISNLDVVVSMDSANMHLASLFGVPVVSIWGGTHPYLGFYGWGQDPGNAIQVNLECRPSSVFGNKPCPRGDLACLKRITPEMVAAKIFEQLGFR